MKPARKAAKVKAVTLSDDAKAVAGAWFGFGNMESSLTFHLRESKPSDRAQAGLDELVRAGYLSVEPFNRFGGVIYRPLRDLREYGAWLMQNRDNPVMKFPLTEPLAPRRASRGRR